MNKKTMKEMVTEERPYERCIRNGTESLSDAELLSVILRTGSRSANALELAQTILALNYPQGILGLLHLTLPELLTVDGIGEVKAIQIQCVGELSKRIWKKAAVDEDFQFRDPRSIADFYMEDMRHQEQEELHLMLFNTKNLLVKELLLSRGTVNMSVISPREILIQALRYHAVHVILVHNHPSGDPAPSKEDFTLTQRVKEAGNLIGIPLIDHIIIGDNSYISFRERGIL